MKQIKSLIKKFCSTSYARMHILCSSESEMRCHSGGSVAQLLSRCDSSPHADLLTPLTPLPPRGLNAAATVTLWLYLSNLDVPLRSRLLSGVCVLSPLKSYFSARIWISLWEHPPLCLAIMSCLIVRSLTSKNPADSVISQISDLVNIINLKLSSHFSPYVLHCLCLFLSLSLSLSLSFSGLHPLQNSYCPGQRGDRLLLLEDDCLHRDQDREWIPTSNWVLTITFILKCQPCTPPKPTFCVWVFF